MQQRPANLPDPEQFFRDPSYVEDTPKISQKDMDSLMNRREEFKVQNSSNKQPDFTQFNKQQAPTQPKVLQLNEFENDLKSLKIKVRDMEKRLETLKSSQYQPPTQQYKPPVQSGFNFEPSSQQNKSTGFQPYRPR